jgi:hypothetical protein
LSEFFPFISSSLNHELLYLFEVLSLKGLLHTLLLHLGLEVDVVISEPMPVHTSDTLLELEDFNLFQLLLIEEAICCQVDTWVNLFSLLKEVNAVKRVINLLLPEQVSCLLVLFVNLSETTTHLFWEELWAHISEVVDERLSGSTHRPVAVRPE